MAAPTTTPQPSSGDGGVDGVINEDRLGLDRVYVQAKRYKDGSVGRPNVQALLGSLVGLGETKGVFAATSTFTIQVKELFCISRSTSS